MSAETVHSDVVLHLEEGVTVKPFEGSRRFLPVNLAEFLNISHSAFPFPSEEPVLTRSLEFAGISGQLIAVVSSRIGTQEVETPLGPVKTEIEFNNGIVEVKQIPLFLRLLFNLQSVADVEKLLYNRAVFELGDRRYVVKYGLERPGVTTENFIQGLEDFKSLPAIGANLWSLQTYQPTVVALPYDLDRVSQVGLGVIDFRKKHLPNKTLELPL